MSYQSDIEKVTRFQESADFPSVILLDNVNACNLKCSMCDHENMKQYRPIERMDMGLYRKIIDEIAVENPGARIWEIFFGDPFLLKDMPERIGYAKDKGLTDVVNNTNGVLMTPEKSEAFIKAGQDAIYVGIDAAKKETYDKIRVGGDFDRAVSNVLAYRDLLEKYGNPEQKIFVQFVVSEYNEDEVEQFREFWTRERVNVKIRPKVSWAGLISADNLGEVADADRRPCYWLMRAMNICADGRVTLCSVDIHCRVPCGNVRDNTLKQVWNGKLGEYREMHKQKQFSRLPEMCAGCRDWQSTYAEFY